MRVHLPPHPRSAGQARAHVREFLRRHDAAGIPADTALLVVSELVTNAVQAAAGRVELELRIRGNVLTIRVEDDATGVPAVQRPDRSSERGRGLRIVDALVDSWAVKHTKRGKVVTAKLSSASAD